MSELNKPNVVTTPDAGADHARDVHQPHYTTTPPESRVSSSNEGLGAAVAPEMPDPGAVTEPFDHLATRDPEAMEQRLQAPEFAGSTAVETGINPSVLDAVGPGVEGNLTGAAVNPVASDLLSGDNSGYTAPAVSGPPHVREQPGDLPPGASTELKSEIENR
ncbi:MAG: hypothetical protein Q4C89_04520 [Deinococcus sp.]|uniref:hypothetical protein n=1 Tax=Deinococcus sp. TaxID=47478 RepID=UPI0026DB6FAA|nr:hypothetical protein [Deinococcus sp.]MDO4245265.1 hypothetical protein [Deinococcus sp.]